MQRNATQRNAMQKNHNPIHVHHNHLISSHQHLHRPRTFLVPSSVLSTLHGPLHPSARTTSTPLALVYRREPANPPRVHVSRMFCCVAFLLAFLLALRAWKCVFGIE
jgi:hypothetical protein